MYFSISDAYCFILFIYLPCIQIVNQVKSHYVSKIAMLLSLMGRHSVVSPD